MDFIHWLIDFVLHIDVHLTGLIAEYGALTVGIIALIIFCETGLVVTPILPGDSMIFAFGALAAQQVTGLNVHLSGALFVAAAFLGNLVNYSVGKFIGPRVYEKNYKLIKPEYLVRTRKFFEKHGGKTIIITRFAPVLRTFAPFVAGVGQMPYGRFILFNFIGGFTWVLLFLYAGYFFGNVPFVKQHFDAVVLAIVGVSLVPAVVVFVKQRFKKK